jgi:predicted ATPase
MTYKNWQKGSQWRKWDLHVHTPASFHWNSGKLLRDMDLEEKEKTFAELLKTIEDSDVSVFCFMDYWTFDGYIQFKNYLAKNNLTCSKTVFPGMELRIEAPVDYRLNIHVILSDSLSNQLLDDFKSKLTVRSINRRISDDAIIEFAKSLSADKAKINGFGDPQKLSQNELLKLGSSTIEVTKESLESAIKTLPPRMAYIMQPFDTSGGLSGLDWKTQPHAANYFLQSAHVIESRDDDIANLFLGIETNKNRTYIENFRKSLDYVQKPVICGSDAHRYADYGQFPSKKATWIKADPTFNGFKQIIYEPRERVALQELQPHEKIPYRVIDKVRFIDKTGQKLFASNWIDLNENLNTIIGGKSSGKSLLLYHIAKTISPLLVAKRSKEVPILNYKFGDLNHFDFEVLWKDGLSQKLSTSSDDSREIEYIPQLYVNVLAEKQGEASLYKLIETILEQNFEYREFIQKIKQEIANLEMAIDSNVAELLRKREELQTLYDERKAVGGKQEISAEIDRLSSEIKRLRDASNFSDIETSEYEKLLHLRLQEQRKKQEYEELGHSIESSAASLDSIKNQAVQAVSNITSTGTNKLSKRVLSKLISFTKNRLVKSFDLLIVSQKNMAESSRRKAQKSSEREKKLLERLVPYTAKINDQTKLKSFEEKLQAQNTILEAYNKKTALIEDTKDAGVRIKQTLVENYTDLLGCYQKIVEKLIKDQYSRIDADIFLVVKLRFDVEKFSTSFGDLFDRRRTNFRTALGTMFSDTGEFHFKEAEHLKNISTIYEKLTDKSNTNLIFRKGTTSPDAISQLFKNYFEIEYNIRYKNDQILDMSPGKRGMVLLQLILHISNATHPILIDQPEDNLDNRTISNELKQFITAKKQIRQIIMVTHDANLVVLTDAENVIVSNQGGQQIDRENTENRFEYIAGSLENSFRLDETDANKGILFTCGIREHVCDILEGGEAAFKKREEKYGFSDR